MKISLSIKSISFSCIILFLLAHIMILSALSQDIFPDILVIRDSYVPGTGHPIGNVDIVDGDVFIVHNNEFRGFLAKKEMMLYAGDTLISKLHGRISIRLKDNSRISMGSETKIILSRLAFDKDQKQRQSFIQMPIGKARFRVKKLSNFRQSSFKVKTATALIGVRGSDFIIQTTLKRTEVSTLSDTILTMISLAAPDAPPTLMSEYTWGMVEHGQLPSEIEKLSIEVIEELKNAFPIDPVDFVMPQPDDQLSMKHHHDHQQLFSKRSSHPKMEKNIPSFDSSTHANKTYEKSFKTNDHKSSHFSDDEKDSKDSSDSVLLTTESSFTIKKDHNFNDRFSKKEGASEIDERYIRVSSDELIDPEDISSVDIFDKEIVYFEDDLSETIDEDSDDQEQIYEEEQIEKIHLPWFPKKPQD